MLRLRTAAAPAPPETRRLGRLRRWPLSAVAVTVALILVLAQLLLPAAVTRMLRHRLSRDGDVRSARLQAVPAIELLWQQADRATVSMREYNVRLDNLTGLLHRALGVDQLAVTIDTLHTNLLTLDDVSLHKQGAELVGRALVKTTSLQRALPVLQSVEPVDGSDGQLTLRSTTDLLGVRASVTAVLEAADGRLVVTPTGLLGAFTRITVFDDPRIAVQAVTGEAVPGGMVVTVTARTS